MRIAHVVEISKGGKRYYEVMELTSYVKHRSPETALQAYSRGKWESIGAGIWRKMGQP